LSQGRHARTQTGRAKPIVLAGGVAALIAIGVVLFLVLGGGGAGGVLVGGDDAPSTPPFDFELAKIVAVPTRPDAVAKKLHGKARPAAEEVADAMTDLYVGSFLDPEHWQNDEYDDVWSVFSDEAAAEAESRADVLTAGIGAGTAFDSIEPDEGTLRMRVLLDEKDEPFSVVAIVRFSATGSAPDGSSVLMQSAGQFILEQTDDGWDIVSFHVQRNDQREEATTPSGSVSPS
jgi:hypothetical protein